MKKNNKNQQPIRRRGNERNISERNAELAGRQSDPETNWHRSGMYGGRTRKESIAKRDDEGAGEVTVRTNSVLNSSRAFEAVFICMKLMFKC
ncbi:hypothetical protein TNCV_1606591 [Trichonephila clavipes]|nr:hypothetical protein TNCV_1606591 [Trichonephila clavipes]